MASLEDISNALALIIQDAVYPLGLESPSVINNNVRIFMGWPIPKELDEALVANEVMISIFPSPMETVHSEGLGNQWFESSSTTASKETKRQTKQFQISIWANGPTPRGIIVSAVDIVLSDLYRISLTGGDGNIQYVRTHLLDNLEKEGIYRADLYYQVAYPTVKVSNFEVVTAVAVAVGTQDTAFVIDSSSDYLTNSKGDVLFSNN